MRPTRRLITIALLVLATSAAVSGCKVGATPKTGGGENTDICTGYRQYNALRPPVVSDAAAIKGYVMSAQRVLRRIDNKISYPALSGHRAHAPTTVLQQIGQVKQAYAGLEGELRTVNDHTQLLGVVQRFEGSASFEAADTAVELWIGSNCP